jgi:iron(III) transport system ATP-binding protein
MSTIELRSAAKSFGDTAVLTGVDLTAASGSITAVLGASGSGKTTLLRLIAGFERLDRGSLSIGGEVVDDGLRTVPPQRRGVGYVPQEGALFPHLTVAGNVAFGLARGERGEIDDLLELVGLSDLRKRYPHQLSGGQQQRVALARALAIRPNVVLLDEPFAALDAALRNELRRDVARILGETRATTILVTHDQEEALSLAGQVALLDRGRVIAAAEPRQLYREPPTIDTATSIGEVNVLEANTSSGYAQCALGLVPVRRNGSEPPDGASRLLLRPEQLEMHFEDPGEAVVGEVVEVEYYGHDALAHVRLTGQDEALLARVSGEVEVERGRRVWIRVVGVGTAWPPGGTPSGA